jgi:hypothetical protein
MHALLPFYVTGTLEAAEAEAFRAHLERCASCRKDRGLLERAAAELAQHGAALLEDHPSPEQLVAGVRGELEGVEADSVRRHLALCTACAVEASWVRGDAEVRERRTLRPAHLGWAAAAAALLALVLLRPWAPPSGTGIVRAHFVAATERAEDVPRIALGPGERVVRLLVEADAPAGGYPLAVEIADEQGRVLFERSGVLREELVEGRYLALDCDRRDCPAGRYEVRLRPARALTPPIRLPFELTED